ncbi:hypothetical protein HDU97_005039 [Phlyctochytrium planicorne]|nr:hypothetical protein HDU97_005039 [Phlyctochytrium planicorne]
MEREPLPRSPLAPISSGRSDAGPDRYMSPALGRNAPASALRNESSADRYRNGSSFENVFEDGSGASVNRPGGQMRNLTRNYGMDPRLENRGWLRNNIDDVEEDRRPLGGGVAGGMYRQRNEGAVRSRDAYVERGRNIFSSPAPSSRSLREYEGGMTMPRVGGWDGADDRDRGRIDRRSTMAGGYTDRYGDKSRYGHYEYNEREMSPRPERRSMGSSYQRKIHEEMELERELAARREERMRDHHRQEPLRSVRKSVGGGQSRLVDRSYEREEEVGYFEDESRVFDHESHEDRGYERSRRSSVVSGRSMRQSSVGAGGRDRRREPIEEEDLRLDLDFVDDSAREDEERDDEVDMRERLFNLSQASGDVFGASASAAREFSPSGMRPSPVQNSTPVENVHSPVRNAPIVKSARRRSTYRIKDLSNVDLAEDIDNTPAKSSRAAKEALTASKPVLGAGGRELEVVPEHDIEAEEEELDARRARSKPSTSAPSSSAAPPAAVSKSSAQHNSPSDEDEQAPFEEGAGAVAKGSKAVKGKTSKSVPTPKSTKKATRGKGKAAASPELESELDEEEVVASEELIEIEEVPLPASKLKKGSTKTPAKTLAKTPAKTPGKSGKTHAKVAAGAAVEVDSGGEKEIEEEPLIQKRKSGRTSAKSVGRSNVRLSSSPERSEPEVSVKSKEKYSRSAKKGKSVQQELEETENEQPDFSYGNDDYRDSIGDFTHDDSAPHVDDMEPEAAAEASMDEGNEQQSEPEPEPEPVPKRKVGRPPKSSAKDKKPAKETGRGQKRTAEEMQMALVRTGEEDVSERSKRVRIKPLEYWRNERVKYGLRKSLTHGIVPEIKSIIRVPKEEEEKPFVSHSKPKKKGAEKKSAEAKSTLDAAASIRFEAFDEDIAEQMRQSYLIPAKNFLTDETEDMVVACSKEMVNPSTLVDREANEYHYQRTFTLSNFVGTGILLFQPGGTKSRKATMETTVVFYVMAGEIEVTLNESTIKVAAAGHCIVPRGNYYSLKNVYDGDTLLFFVQCRETTYDYVEAPQVVASEVSESTMEAVEGPSEVPVVQDDDLNKGKAGGKGKKKVEFEEEKARAKAKGKGKSQGKKKAKKEEREGSVDAGESGSASLSSASSARGSSRKK